MSSGGKIIIFGKEKNVANSWGKKKVKNVFVDNGQKEFLEPIHWTEGVSGEMVNWFSGIYVESNTGDEETEIYTDRFA